MVCDVYNEALEFVPQGDMANQRYGVYVYELGQRKVLVSPAAYSLWQTDKASFIDSLEVWKDGRIVHVLDLGGSL